MTARGATSADLPAMARLHAASFTPAWDEAALAQLLAAGGQALVAGPAGELTGFILTRQAADEAEILTITVDNATRRTGVGRALVKAAAGSHAASGASRMFLEVASGNVAARALYSSLGFVKAGERKAYYHPPGGPPDDALVLVAALPLYGLGKVARVD